MTGSSKKEEKLRKLLLLRKNFEMYSRQIGRHEYAMLSRLILEKGLPWTKLNHGEDIEKLQEVFLKRKKELERDVKKVDNLLKLFL